MIAPTNGTFAGTRLTVANNTGSELIYDAANGITVYSNTVNRGLAVGSATAGRMRITGGTFSTAGSTFGADVIAHNATGTLIVDGGNFISPQLSMGIGAAGNGLLAVSNGTATITKLIYNYTVGGASGTVELAGGTLTVSNISNAGVISAFNFNGGTLKPFDSSPAFFPNVLGTVSVRNGGAIIDTAGNSVSIRQPLLHSAISGDPAVDGGLTKNGNGTLALSATNTYNGPTTVSAGTLTLSNNLAIQNSALVTTGGGTVILASGVTTPTFGGLSGSSGNLATVISSGYNNVTTLTLNPTNAGTLDYGGVIADGASGMTLTKSGTGTQTLSATNSYSGGTTVGGGSLRTSVNEAFGSGAVMVGTNANVWFNPTQSSSNVLNYANAIILSNGAAVYAGPASYTTNGDPGYKAQGGVTNNGPVSISGTVTLASSAMTPLVFAGPISGSGGLTVTYAPGAMGDGGSPNVLPGFSLIYLTNPTNNWTGGTTILWGNGGYSGGVNDANRVYAASLGSGPIQLGAPAMAGYRGVAFLYLTAANAIKSDSVVSMYDNTYEPPGAYYSQVDLNGYSQTIAGLSSFGANGAWGAYCKVLSASGSPTLTISNSGNYTFRGVISSGLNLVKAGAGTQTLTNANTYSGNTTISGGTLALTGGGSISNSPAIVIAAGASFDVSGRNSIFTLGSSQTLSNSAVGAILNGNINTGSGSNSLVFDGVTPSFTVTNGTLTLSASTVFTVTKPGDALAPGVYKIIAKATDGSAGTVAGTVPTVTVLNGTSQAALGIVNGELWLTNNSLPSAWSYSGSSFTYNGSTQGPTISFSGSTGAKTTNYVGTGATTYSSVNPPVNAGTYYVSNTVAADANYIGATNSQAFTIAKAPAAFTLSSSANPAGYLDGVTFTAGGFLTDVTGAVQFRTNSVDFGGDVTISSQMAVSAVTTALPRGTVTIGAAYGGNENYLPTTNTLTQTVTNHPPIALNFTSSVFNGDSVNLDVLASKKKPTDLDGDTLTITAVSTPTSGLVVTNGGTGFIYTATNATVGTNTFTYTVSDGYGGEATATVTMVVFAAQQGLNITGFSYTNPVATVTAQGIPGATYRLQYTTNASPILWLDVSGSDTQASTNTGTMVLQDTGATDNLRFYRTKHISGP